MQGTRISVEEAAKMLNMPPQAVRIGLQRGLFNFGIAQKSKENKKQYAYYIFRERVEKYIKGEDMICQNS